VLASVTPPLLSLAIASCLFVGILLCLELGYRTGRQARERHPEWAHEGIGVIEAAVFALLGLLLGFSFAGGASRLDDRRQLIIKEANAIGTAYLRLDLLPAPDQPEMRGLFRKYLDARLGVYDALPDESSSRQQLDLSNKLQEEIWRKSVEDAGHVPSQDTTRLLLPALNEMMDVATARTIALRTRLPNLIFALLTLVALLSGILAGFAMAKRQTRSRLHMFIYAGVIALTVFAILDLDDPRSGLIRLTRADSALLQLRESIR
jgi:hypothetical protein